MTSVKWYLLMSGTIYFLLRIGKSGIKPPVGSICIASVIEAMADFISTAASCDPGTVVSSPPNMEVNMVNTLSLIHI